MTDDDPKPMSQPPEPAPDTEQAGFKKVDTKVQEEAAEEREESGGYD